MVAVCMIPFEKKNSDLNTMPEQTAHVEAIKVYTSKTSGHSRNYRACFKFEDGTEKLFDIGYEVYLIIEDGEKGTLFYKELPNKKDGMNNRLFIRFEKD